MATTSVEFPLYTSLQEQISTLTTTNTDDVWKYVINIPYEHLEMVYALLWHHYMLEVVSKTGGGGINVVKKNNVPYKGKLFDNGRGIIFQVKDIPIELQKIIALYIRLSFIV